MKKRYTEEQIIGFLREADAGLPIKELCRKHGFSEPFSDLGERFGTARDHRHSSTVRNERLDHPQAKSAASTVTTMFLSLRLITSAP